MQQQEIARNRLVSGGLVNSRGVGILGARGFQGRLEERGRSWLGSVGWRGVE
jgi:hypothetical protein